MTDLRKAAERAIRQLVAYQDFTGDSRIANECGEIIEALRQALAKNPLDIADRAYFASKKDGIDETIALIRSKNT